MSAVAQTPQVRWRHVKNRLETRRVLRTEPIHNGMTGAKRQDNQLTRIEVEAIASIEDQHAPAIEAYAESGQPRPYFPAAVETLS